ncbi:MAG: glutamyl-tRNA reductase [Spirochaetia bacterium]
MKATVPLEHAVFCIGVSHHGASLDLLERLSIPADGLASALEPFRARDDGGKRLCEGVILSTCNRTEIYAAPHTVLRPGPAPPRFEGLPVELVHLLCRRSGLGPEELAGRVFRHDGWAAVDHLFRVVCGLDSLAVGESQILRQVARAYAAAQAGGTAGVALSTLFQEALRGGRRARARIGFAAKASSIGSMAVARAEELCGPLASVRTVVIGTGALGRTVLQSLRERGARRVHVVSRIAERAAAAAARGNFAAHPLSALPALVGACDLLISTTRATAPLLPAELCAGAAINRAGRNLVLIDISVPRTIDPKANGLPGVTLLDIDSFKQDHESSCPSPEELLTEEMIREDRELLRLRMKELALRPVIGELWRRAAAIRGEVLQRARQRLPRLDEQSWNEVEGLATSLVARLLHDPATRLRAEAGNGHAAEYAEAIRQLFGAAE